MRYPVSAGLVLVLLSGCTAGTNQAGLIDCGSFFAQNARNRPAMDAETRDFCNPRSVPNDPPPREPPPPPAPREATPPPPPPAPSGT